jgi:hypothetical protein
MMALLAGSKLAINTLGLTSGSTLRLAQIFPKVPHIDRFDLRTDVAARILDDAELHLSTMAIPYVLALHEDYMMQSARMLVNETAMSRSVHRALNAKTMHEQFAGASGGQPLGQRLWNSSTCCARSGILRFMRVVLSTRNATMLAGRSGR